MIKLYQHTPLIINISLYLGLRVFGPCWEIRMGDDDD